MDTHKVGDEDTEAENMVEFDHLPENLLLYKHWKEILKLSNHDLMVTGNRNALKSSLISLDAFLSNYHDSEYTQAMTKLRTGIVGEPNAEIGKCSQWIVNLKQLLSRTPLLKRPVRKVQSIEEVEP